MNDLKTLSFSELRVATDEAVRAEKDAITNTTRHFQAIFSRKAYLPQYNSMFEFLTKRYGYCASSAQMRIETLRLIHDIPEVRQKIEAGKLSMSAAASIQSFITAEKKSERPLAPATKAELISKCLGKTKIEVQKEFAKINPQTTKRENVRVVSVDEFRANINLSDKAHKNLKELQDILSHVDPNMTLGQLIERLSEDGLDKYCPKRKAERVQQSAERKKLEAEVVAEGKTISPDEIKRTRYVPAKEKHEVARSRQCCSFVDEATGEHCSSTKFLQLDHITPFADGGENNSINLRWMCGVHNRWRYESTAH